MQPFQSTVRFATGHNRTLKYGVVFALVMGGGDRLVGDGSAFRQTLRFAGTGWQGVRGLKNLFDAINDIDDRIDALPVEVLLSAGKAEAGSEPSAFIRNPAIVSAEDWKKIDSLSQMGVMPRDELVSFLNAMGVSVVAEAEAAKDYEKEFSAEARHRIAQAHIDLTVVTMAAVAQVCKKNPAFRTLLRDGLSVSHIRGAYPNNAILAETLQTQDDLRDLVADLKEEIRTGRPSPNIFLADVHDKGALLDADHHLRSEYLALAAADGLHMKDLPAPLRTAIYERFAAMHARCRALPAAVRKTLAAMSEITMQDELSSAPVKTPDYDYPDSLPIALGWSMS